MNTMGSHKFFDKVVSLPHLAGLILTLVLIGGLIRNLPISLADTSGQNQATSDPSSPSDGSRLTIMPSPTPFYEDLAEMTRSQSLLIQARLPLPAQAIPYPGLAPSEQISIQGVIGSDERRHVSPTTNPPWRSIVSLDVRFSNGRGSCTGFFIGPRIIATAGHCVYDFDDGGGWATSVRVIPGRDGLKEPFGWQYALQIFTNNKWVQEGDRQLDFGAVQLPDNTLSNKVGWFPYAAFTDQSLLGLSPNLVANLAGYPGMEPLPFNCPEENLGFSGCQLWFGTGNIPAASWSRLIECPGGGNPCTWIEKGLANYKIDTSGGQSGAPVWLYNGQRRVVVAIHTYSYEGMSSPCETQGGPYNCGTLITAMVADLYEYWGAAPRLAPPSPGLPLILGPFIAETPDTDGDGNGIPDANYRGFLPVILKNNQ